jgi:polyisoprenoid-binding protein YceI
MTAPTDLATGTWTVDQSHSSVSFSVRHLMISKVRGSFTAFSGTVTVPEDRLATVVDVTIDPTSVNTGDAMRDGHLKNNDFFDVEKFPTMQFKSSTVVAKGSSYVLAGNLTVRGVTKPVELDVEFEGIGTDPYNNTKAGFSATGEINRKDWGVEFNMPMEAGGFVIGDKVKLELDVQLLKSA